VVLAGRPDHCRAANIDVLNGIIDRGIFTRDRLFERVEIYNQQIDRLDAVFFHDRLIGTATTEQATVNNGVQRLDATAHDFGEAGFFRNLDDVESGFTQLTAGSAG